MPASSRVDADGEPIGAAWYRMLPRSDPGFGYVGTGVPELIIGVRPIWRAHGVGPHAAAGALRARARAGLRAAEPERRARQLRRDALPQRGLRGDAERHRPRHDGQAPALSAAASVVRRGPRTIAAGAASFRRKSRVRRRSVEGMARSSSPTKNGRAPAKGVLVARPQARAGAQALRRRRRQAADHRARLDGSRARAPAGSSGRSGPRRSRRTSAATASRSSSCCSRSPAPSSSGSSSARSRRRPSARTPPAASSAGSRSSCPSCCCSSRAGSSGIRRPCTTTAASASASGSSSSRRRLLPRRSAVARSRVRACPRSARPAACFGWMHRRAARAAAHRRRRGHRARRS